MRQASNASSGDSGQVVAAASKAHGRFPPPGARDLMPLPPRPTREQLDQALQCMSDHGFGMGTPLSRGGKLIPRSETKTQKFRQAAKECELPPPPTDAQIRQMACHAVKARREGNG